MPPQISLYEPQRHIPALDGLRGIAIFATIGIHILYTRAMPSAPPTWLSIFHVLQFGWMGVDLFFVLSGFLITGILLDSRRSTNYFRSFYARRALRIFPIYYTVLLVCLLAGPIVLRTRMAGLIPSHTFLALCAVYLQSWSALFPPAPPGALGAYWSLGIEEQFYLFWPLLVLLLPRRSLATVCLILCALCPILRFMLYRHHVSQVFILINTATRMDTLLWGSLGALLVRSPAWFDRLRPWFPRAFTLSVAAILIIDFPLHELYTRALYTETVGFTVIAIASVTLLLLAYISDTLGGRFARLLTHPVLRSLGRYSYGMYLLQGLVFIAMRVYLQPRSWFGRSVFSGLIIWIAAMGSIWALAWLSYNLMEARILRLKSRFKPSWRDPSTLPPRPSL